MTDATALPISPGELKEAFVALTPAQKDALRIAYQAKQKGYDWMDRASCAPWRCGGVAIYALNRKGLLLVERLRGRARLTDFGCQLVEAFPLVFGLPQKKWWERKEG